jgi:hypothetical protein
MDKVEEIRKKPENIRMRYVWFFVAVSMFFVIILWIFSLQAIKQESQPSTSSSNLFDSDVFDQFGEQKKALDAAQQDIQNSLSNPGNAASGSPQSGEQNNQGETNLNNGTGQ